jgi:hypothetical protein
VKVPFTQSCWLHHCVFGSHWYEQIVFAATTPFLPKAQAPGGSFIASAEATDSSATVPASNAIFTIDIMRIFVPHPCKVSFYIVVNCPQAIASTHWTC